MKRLEHLYRTLATGFCFCVFFVMGVSFRVFVCPLLALIYRHDARQKVLTARRVVQKSFAFFTALMQGLGVLKLTINGREKLAAPGLLICPSHPTLIDVVILMSLIPNANCIVKAALAQKAAMKGPLKTAGYLTNDNGPALVDACAETLALGDTLIIFPEGTRSVPGKIPHLQHGAAAAALAAKSPVTPVRITCEPPSLMKGIPWYRIPERPMHITVTVLEAIDPAPFLAAEMNEGRPKAVRSLTRTLFSSLFSQLTTAK